MKKALRFLLILLAMLVLGHAALAENTDVLNMEIADQQAFFRQLSLNCDTVYTVDDVHGLLWRQLAANDSWEEISNESYVNGNRERCYQSGSKTFMEQFDRDGFLSYEVYKITESSTIEAFYSFGALTGIDVIQTDENGCEQQASYLKGLLSDVRITATDSSTTEWIYDDAGILMRKIQLEQQDGRIIGEVYYDGQGAFVAAYQFHANSDAAPPLIACYDENGILLEQYECYLDNDGNDVEIHLDASGALISTRHGYGLDGNWQTETYDASGALIETTVESSTDYDESIIRFYDANNVLLKTRIVSSNDAGRSVYEDRDPNGVFIGQGLYFELPWPNW